MRTSRLAVLAASASLLLGGCVTAVTRTRTWGEPAYAQPQQQGWERYGRVERIRETVQEVRGNPAGGAVAGAIVGSVIGSAADGHGHGPGGLIGAIAGGILGAAASEGHEEHRTYEVVVRFEDGGLERFYFQEQLPYQVGDEVVLTPRGLYPAR
jgi:outer membrane lipoprotein SlyB